MADIDYNELFGIGGTNGESANTQEVADPADGDPTETGEGEGANESGFADLTDNDENDAGEGETGEPDAPAGEQDPGKREQTKRERAGFAAARREAEAKASAELAAEKERAKSEMESFIRSLGLKDANGNEIATREAYEAYRASERAEELRRKMRRGGFDPETLDDYIAEHPAVKAAMRIQREAEERAREAEIDAAIAEQIRQVEKIDPTVKSVEDLRAKPYFSDVLALVREGDTIVKAVKLATYDERMRQIAEGSAKSAAAKAASKAHLVPTQSRGQGTADVPAEVESVYRKLYPGISDAEILKKYQRVNGKNK